MLAVIAVSVLGDLHSRSVSIFTGNSTGNRNILGMFLFGNLASLEYNQMHKRADIKFHGVGTPVQPLHAWCKQRHTCSHQQSNACEIHKTPNLLASPTNAQPSGIGQTATSYLFAHTWGGFSGAALAIDASADRPTHSIHWHSNVMAKSTASTQPAAAAAELRLDPLAAGYALRSPAQLYVAAGAGPSKSAELESTPRVTRLRLPQRAVLAHAGTLPSK
eukprot:1157595-Pelagomonas_calceolata.AAC.6